MASTTTYEVPGESPYRGETSLTAHVKEQFPEAPEFLHARFADEVASAETALRSAMSTIEDTLNDLRHENGMRAAGELYRFADLAGYSNTAATYVAEAFARAGKAVGMLEGLRVAHHLAKGELA